MLALTLCLCALFIKIFKTFCNYNIGRYAVSVKIKVLRPSIYFLFPSAKSVISEKQFRFKAVDAACVSYLLCLT